MTIWKEAADIKAADQLNLPTPKVVYHNEVAHPTEHQQEMVQQLSERAAEVHSGKVAPWQDGQAENLTQLVFCDRVAIRCYK
ncbi:MAG: hypothetical protein ACI4AB_09350 [Acetatifactor sp.]